MNQYRRHVQRVKSANDRFVVGLGSRSNLAGTVIRMLWETASRRINASDGDDFEFWQWRHACGLEDPFANPGDLDRLESQHSLTDDVACQAWRKQWSWFDGDSIRDAQLLLFCVQTYLAIVVRWTVWSQLKSRRSSAVEAQQPFAVDRELLKAVHTADAFHEFGWSGFETTLFDWFPLNSGHDKSNSLAEFAGEVVQLSFCDESSAQSAIDHFRPIYLDLIPRKVRHALGEYYTPRWLAEWVLDAIGYQGQTGTRLLDPSCGSGTFLVAAIARWKKIASADHGVPWTLESAPIVGVDTNPIAVICARANLLLALGDIPRDGRGLIQIPVLHADSILGIERHFGAAPFEPQPSGNKESASHHSLPIGEFTHIAGNPPWVGWETLAKEYRELTTPLWKRYRLFVDQGMDTILGKGKKDLSMLMSYVVSDRYLADKGKLSFVITNSVFLNHGAGRGFRGLRLSPKKKDRLKIEGVDDLSDVAPFENASTRASVFVWEKGNATRYPVPYRQWHRDQPLNDDQRMEGNSTSVEHLYCRPLVAQPCLQADLQSSWMVAPVERLEEVQRLLRPSTYRAYEGANSGGANGIYWLQSIDSAGRTEAVDLGQAATMRVRNRADLGKKKTATVETEIETTFLFPMVRGVQLRKWYAESDTFLLLVQDPETRRGIEPVRLKDEAPLTWQYLTRFESQLRARAAFRKFFQRQSEGNPIDTAAYYSMFNVGPYSMSKFKVAWHRMKAPIEAAVLGMRGGRFLMPQETHAFIPCEDELEAHFLAAMLNSSTFNHIAAATAQRGGKSFGSPHLLQRVYLPEYCQNDSIHREVATIAKKIHDSMSVEQGVVRLEDFEASLEPLTASIFEASAAAAS